jgi:hypothetical protein
MHSITACRATILTADDDAPAIAASIRARAFH